MNWMKIKWMKRWIWQIAFKKPYRKCNIIIIVTSHPPHISLMKHVSFKEMCLQLNYYQALPPSSVSTCTIWNLLIISVIVFLYLCHSETSNTLTSLPTSVHNKLITRGTFPVMITFWDHHISFIASHILIMCFFFHC